MLPHSRAHPTRYWFKPARFWNWFAAYYPVSWEGWAITVAGVAIFVWTFRRADRDSHSVSDTLIAFGIPAILIFIAFDFATRLTGEYPSWWKQWKK